MSKYIRLDEATDLFRGIDATMTGGWVADTLESLPTIEVSEDELKGCDKVAKRLKSYEAWVDLEDSEIIAECAHRFGGEYVVKACEDYIGKADRPKGEWRTTDAYPHRVYCSECYKTFAQSHWEVWEDGSLPRNYCPNCGADMRGDKE